MTEPGALLARAGLGLEIRANICLQAAVVRGDWGRAAATVVAARQTTCRREHLAEGLLQGVLFYGFPRSITVFEILRNEWPGLPPAAARIRTPEQEVTDGRALFAAIYDTNTAAVERMLADAHGELRDFVLEVAYGRILSRPQLPAVPRELIAIGVLAAMEQTPQMVGHGRGALRMGATRNEVREALLTALDDDGQVETALRRIDGRTR